MRTPFLHTALRRALLVSLAVPALADLGACGGKVVLDHGTGGSVGAAGGGSAVGGSNASAGGSVTGDGCALASSTPVSIVGGGCEEVYDLVGPSSACSPGAGGSLTPTQCTDLCPPNMGGVQAESCNTNQGQLDCVYGPCGTGRRPAGLAPAKAAAPGPVARFLGDAAHLEAVSVIAFEQLAAELSAHGAPQRLVRRARRAAREEVRHAKVMGRFAARAGARVPGVAVAPTPPRPIEAIAIENAVEGCVRETFGAVVAMRQAERARSGDLRRAMRRIARDEASHAALSWDLGRWLEGRLDEAGKRRVREAQDRAVASLAREAARAPAGRLVTELGLPTAAQARAAVDALRSSIWA